MVKVEVHKGGWSHPAGAQVRRLVGFEEHSPEEEVEWWNSMVYSWVHRSPPWRTFGDVEDRLSLSQRSVRQNQRRKSSKLERLIESRRRVCRLGEIAEVRNSFVVRRQRQAIQGRHVVVEAVERGASKVSHTEQMIIEASRVEIQDGGTRSNSARVRQGHRVEQR
jgi:hypothetical protein